MAQSDSKQNFILPAHYVRVLYESYQTMAEMCLALKEAVHSDSAEYPVFVPTHGVNEEDKVSQAAREAAMDSMTQLFILRKEEHLPNAGILCASADTVSAVSDLNASKLAFKKAVMAIRNFQKDQDGALSRVSKLINDEILEKGYRTKSLKKAMGTAGISSLDLKRCYAQIRIMPPALDVFSWTWATQHARIKKISLSEAIEMAKKLPEKEASETALALLRQSSPGEMLVRKVPLPNQLRANYAYKEDGFTIRKSCPISGIVIAQQKNMPRKLWRDNPGSTTDLPRLPRESSIEQEVFIKVLDLHRYAR
jgi:hypothetical protein